MTIALSTGINRVNATSHASHSLTRRIKKHKIVFQPKANYPQTGYADKPFCS